VTVSAVVGVDGASLVTDIFSSCNMGGTMWVGETAVTCLDGHWRCFFTLDINTMKLLVCLEDLYMIYLLTAIALTPGGSSTVHIYTQTIHGRHKTNNI